jgi:hypothetical protein
MANTIEQSTLGACVATIAPLLLAEGFAYLPAEAASSSAGPFAAGVFRRGEFEIGLVVRTGKQLGCPNYSYGTNYIGHEDLMDELDAPGMAELVPGPELSYVARHGGDPFNALRTDLERVVLPALRADEANLRVSFDNALNRLRRRRGW